MKKNHSHKFNLLDDIYQLTLEKTGLQRAEPVNEVDQLF